MVLSRRTSEVLSWLLEPDHPSVKYFALRDLCGLRESDPQVREAKAAIMADGPVPRILAQQKAGGYWGIEADFYIRAKYKGTVWSLILLAELGADGADPRIRNACEFMLRWSQDRQSGGFSYVGSASGGGFHSGVIPCLTGNMVWSMLRLGFKEDPRAWRGRSIGSSAAGASTTGTVPHRAAGHSTNGKPATAGIPAIWAS